MRIATAIRAAAGVSLAAGCGAERADPPTYCGDAIPQQEVLVDEKKTIKPCFDNPAGGGLTISATSADESVVRASPVGRNVDIAGVSPGNARVKIEATNEDSLSADVSFSVQVGARSRGTEREALVALYEATGGPGWTRRNNWLSDAPLGEWEGVGTNDDGTVDWLDLGDNGLEGRLPPGIGDLPELVNLRLENNLLEGPLPAELANASGLAELDLRRNGLTGSIPAEFTQLHDMYRFYWIDNDGLCAPSDQEFQDWLDGVGYAVGPTCDN